jgi:outer membrane protein
LINLLASALKGERSKPRRSWCKTISVVALLVLALGQCSFAAEPQGTGGRLTLDEAYRMALASHEQIAIAEKEIQKSKLLPYKAFSLMLPHVDLTGQYLQVNKPISTGINNLVIVPHTQLYGEFKVTNSIFSPDYFPQRRKSLESISKSINQYYQTIQDVLFQVAKQYYQVLQSGEQVEVARQMLKLGHEEVRTTKSKFASGAVTEDAVLRAELDLSAAENKLIENKNQNKLATDTLRHLIALKTPQYEVAKPAPLPEVRDSYATLLGKAYDHRYDYKLAVTEINLAKTDIDKVKAKFLPSVDASWQYYGVTHPSWEQESNNWLATVQVKMPIMEGGLRVWELREKQESLQQAKLSLDDKKRTIKTEVEDALLNTQNNKMLLLQLQKQVNLAQKNYDIILTKFKYGGATILDLSQAFTTLSSSKTDLVNKTYGYQLSLLVLDKAVGQFVLLLTRETKPLSDHNLTK